MPGIVRAKIRDLAFHPGLAVFTFDVRAHRRNQVAHCPNAAFGRAKAEAELIGGAHGMNLQSLRLGKRVKPRYFAAGGNSSAINFAAWCPTFITVWVTPAGAQAASP